MNKQKTIFFFLRVLDGGGVSTHCADLANAIIPYGYEVIFFYGGESGGSKGEAWFKKQGFTIYYLGFSKKDSFRSYLKNIPSYVRFISLLSKYKPEIIHCHFRSTAIFAMIGKALRNTKSILTVHLHNMPNTPATRFFQSRFDHYIAISSEIGQDLESLKVNPEKVSRVFNGVDNTRYKDADAGSKTKLRLKYGFHPDKLTVLVVARLVKSKSVDTFIKAIAGLNQRSKDNIQCIVVGDGGNKSKLTELTNEYGLQTTVSFVGYCDPVDYYALSDVYVLPSTNEGFSIAVVEAMLSGLAIVRTPTSGCYDQVIENQNGFIFPFHDHKELAKKIELLLDDPKKLRSMQQASLKLAESKFTLKVMTDATVEIYKQLSKGENYKQNLTTLKPKPGYSR